MSRPYIQIKIQFINKKAMKFTWSTLILAIILQVSKSQGDSVERRIIVSDKVPAPLAYYSQAVQVNNVLYISGNLGMTTNGDLVDGVTNQTKLALDNIGHILEAAGTTFDHGMIKEFLKRFKHFIQIICGHFSG